MKLNSMTTSLVALFAAGSLGLASAILVQPFNYMLDDTSMVSNSQQQDGGSLSPFYNDQAGSAEHNADRDIIEIIGERLARMRFAKMLDASDALGASSRAHLSQEMAELLDEQQKAAQGEQGSGQQQDNSAPSFGSSVASMLMDAAAAQAAGSSDEATSSSQADQSSVGVSRNSQISELDTTSVAGPSQSNSLPSKADLKGTQSHWFNPKETIPVLKISSMATPSKYKKVYFRSEKKLVDGAFHSLGADQDSSAGNKKSLMKPFASSGAQRRSSRGTTASAAPPSILQDGVIDFLKKFRDVYIQTRPTSSSPGSSGSSFASSMVAAASAPFVSVLAPSGSRPNFASALSAASSMVNSAMIAQAANTGSGSSSPSSSSPSSSSSSSALSAPGSSGASSTTAGSNSNKSPISAQTYVSFWSKTFPTWVRKMLKQLRRRSLYNSSKRQQQQQHHNHQHGSSLGQAAQAAASGAVASVVGDSSSSTGSSGSSSSSH